MSSLRVALAIAVLAGATAAQANQITRDVAVWYGTNAFGFTEIYVFCLGPLNPSCGTLGNQFAPDLGRSANRFHPIAAPPAVDSNGHLVILEENTSGIAGTEDAALVRRIEPDLRFALTHPDGRIANVASLGGFSGEGGADTPTDTVLVHNRVLMITDAGPSNATFPADVEDGRILRVDLATGESSLVVQNLVNPSAIVYDPQSDLLLVADDLAGFTPARSRLLGIAPSGLVSFNLANEASGFDPNGPAIDIALLPDGDVLWLSRTPIFPFYQIMRVELTLGDPNIGAGTVVAEFVPGLVTPTGLSVDLDSGLVLLSGQTNPASIDPGTGDPFGGIGALFEVDVDTPFDAVDPDANLSLFGNTGFLQTLVPLGVAIAPVVECNDGVDNGFFVGADFGVDPGCNGPFDVSEGPDCLDSIDNDLDGIADDSLVSGPDDGCRVGSNATEERDCADRFDNDGDGLIDFDAGVLVLTCENDMQCSPGRCRNDFCSPGTPALADSGCLDFDSNVENPQCDDGLDNDGDGDTDWPADGGCAGPAEDAESITACNDGVDNDGDGVIDFGGGRLLEPCAVPSDCAVWQSCVANLCDPAPWVHADPECEEAADDNEASGVCTDGLDNDGDGLVDVAGGLVYAPCVDDVACSDAAICPGGGCTCTDSICVPGTPVGPDPQCDGVSGHVETLGECNDGIDNDGDGLVDWQGVPGSEACSVDADCLGTPSCVAASNAAGKPAGCVCVAEVCRTGDPGCRDPGWPSESPACDDGIENETEEFRDDRVDFHGVGFFPGVGVGDPFDFDAGLRLPDPACATAWQDTELTSCNDGINNDRDQAFGIFVEQIDGIWGALCQGESTAALHCPPSSSVCSGSSDEGLAACDVDGLDPFPDEDCRSPSSGSEFGKYPFCGSGIAIVFAVPGLQLLWRRGRRWRPPSGS